MGNPKRSALGGLVLFYVLVSLILPWAGTAQACTATVGASTFGSIQAAVNAAGTFSTISVTGTCTEGVFIGENKELITLDGGGLATINGPDANTQVVLVRGRNITVKRFTITGGRHGVFVQRGGTAIIDGNTIQNAATRGIHVNQHSFAIITNNLIQNNATDGILINENSSARIGFETGIDTVASPNTIQNNTGRGISITRSSNARIVENTISGNLDDGVAVTRDSQADISKNTINSNGGDGIFVSQNSGVNLGNDTGTTIFDLPNSTTVNNVGFGIRCVTNSYADGRLGSLFGNSGATSFAGSCINSLIP